MSEKRLAMPENAISPFYDCPTSQSSVMTMTHTSTSVYTQMSLSHDLSIAASCTRSNRLEHHMSKVTKTKLVCAVANE